LSGNNLTNNWSGIRLDSSSSNNVLSDNNAANNLEGIRLYDSSGNTLSGNNVTANYYGIYLDYSSDNTLSGNNVTANIGYGIYLYGPSGNNTLSGNNVMANNQYGIYLDYSSDNTLSGNNVANNQYGIYLYAFSSGNTLSGNNVANNGNGVYLYYSFDNMFYHNNFVNNINQVYSSDSTNVWDGGYPSGGNYWSDYAGTDWYTGPFQNETGIDGIGDTPYVIDTYNRDRYPLMNPHTPQHDVAIMNVSPFKTVVGLGYSLNVSVTAANLGDYPETCNVTVYANNTQIAKQPVTLETGTSTTVTFTWNTTGFAKGNWTISAYAEPVLNETYVADNNCTCNIAVHVGVPGDISGPTQGVYDGKCDLRDVSYLVIRFNTKADSANWNPNADINNDATVNLRDVSIAIINFNKHE